MSDLGSIVVTNDDNKWYVSIATICYVSCVGLALITVSLFIAVLIKGNSTFKEFPFFTIVWHLTIVNMVTIMIQCSCIVPSMFFDYENDGLWDRWYSWGSRCISLSETITSCLVFLIAINRFSVFVAKKMMPFFSKKNIKYSLGITWLIICVIGYVRLFLMPQVVKFSRKNFEFTDVFLTREGPIYSMVIFLSYAIPSSVFIMYIIIYLFLQKTRSNLNTLNDENNNNDRNLLLQGFLLSISIIIWRTLMTITPRINSSFGIEFLLNLLKSLAAVFNNILNPLLFLTTNTTVRKTLINLFKCESMQPKVVSESDIPTARPKASFHLKIKNRLKKKKVTIEPIVSLTTMDQMETGINGILPKVG